MNQRFIENHLAAVCRFRRSGPSGEPIRLVISGRQPISRQGLRALLTSIAGIEVINEASDGAAGLELALREGAQVMVHDAPAYADSELDCLNSIGSESSSVRVLLLAGSLQRTAVLRAIQLGAHGVLSKDLATVQLLTEAIRALAAGYYWLGAEHVSTITEALHTFENGRADRQKFGLTARELEIVPLMVRGCSNRDIARMLVISIQTVKHHCSHIYDKVGASNRLELALFAIHHRLINSGGDDGVAPEKRSVSSSAAHAPAHPSLRIPDNLL